MKKTTVILAILSGFVSLSYGQATEIISDNEPTNEIQRIGVHNDSLHLTKGGGSIPLSALSFSIPFIDEVELPDKTAFGIANTAKGNGLAIAGRQGAGSSLGLASSAAIFGTSEKGFGVVGLSSGEDTFAGVLGGTDNETGTGVVGRASGNGTGGFFESSEGIALVTGSGNVGIGTLSPEAKLEVNGDMRINTDVGKFVLGYPDNGNQWAMSTHGNGADLLVGNKAENDTAFTGRMAIRQDGRVGIGANNPSAQLEIVHNSTKVQPHLLLTENKGDYARLAFGNSTKPKVHWNINGLAANDPKNSKLNFRFDNNKAEANHMTLLGNGNIGIGNSKPDEKLVIGDNIGSNWKLPAITVGDENGGAVEIGNRNHSISIITNNKREKIQIVADKSSSVWEGSLELFTDGLTIKELPDALVQAPILKLVGNYGLVLQRKDTNFDWEINVIDSSGGLALSFQNEWRGTFRSDDGTYSSLSDRRFKSDIKPMKQTLFKIMQLVPSSYKLIDGNPNQKTSLGFIAQDVEKLFPELVSVSSDERSPGVYSLNYSGFGVLAIKAIQEQQSLIEAQKVRLDRKHIEIENLKTRLERLEKWAKH